MKHIELSSGYKAIVDDEDFEVLSKTKWWSNGGRYARGLINGKEIQMHRFLMKPEDKMDVDHINGDGLDNRRENLRVCTHKENSRNARQLKANRAKLKGVHMNENRWRAQIMVNRKHIHLGYFDTKEEAHEAYKIAAKKYFGEFALV